MLELDWQLGERIRQFRKTISNMTQAEFGDEIGVSRQTVNAYERDRQKPTMKTIEGMCTKYNISPSWLLTGIGSMQDKRFTKSKASENEPTAEQQALVNYINQDTLRAIKLKRLLMGRGIEAL